MLRQLSNWINARTTGIITNLVMIEGIVTIPIAGAFIIPPRNPPRGKENPPETFGGTLSLRVTCIAPSSFCQVSPRDSTPES